jgi:hypothetical protein
VEVVAVVHPSLVEVAVVVLQSSAAFSKRAPTIQ